jgi:hypothetical protein
MRTLETSLIDYKELAENFKISVARETMLLAPAHCAVSPKVPVPEFIDPVFTKTSPKRSFSMTERERFGLVFAKTGSIISGTGCM